MAHIWIESEGEWRPAPLGRDSVPLDSAFRAGEIPEGRATLLRSTGPISANVSDWCLVHGPEQRLTVNGLRSPLGIVCLRDRDEIRSDRSRSVFFSTEVLAAVVPFPGSKRATFCARCRQKIEENDSAVKCPQCAAWHHQSDDLSCWNYSETCARGCGHSTDRNAGYTWSPEENAQ